MIRSGIAVPWNGVVRLGRNHSYFQRATGPVHWGAMSLPVDDLYAVGAAIAGCDLAPLPQDLIVTPRASAMAKLHQLHAAASAIAEHTPAIIAHPEAARGLEQALLQAMVACLRTADCLRNSSAHPHHARIMRRFHAAISERADEAVYIPDLCAIIGVPERTLRLCCSESLGMSPKRYLLLRRMNLARQALRKADASATKVTEIAADYGFWNFGRFAVVYKVLFGQTPSTTLRDPAP